MTAAHLAACAGAPCVLLLPCLSDDIVEEALKWQLKQLTGWSGSKAEGQEGRIFSLGRRRAREGILEADRMARHA